MKTIALISPKGGVGKTLLATNLFVEAWARKISTVLIDLDPQASAAEWADLRPDGDGAVVTAPAPRLKRAMEAARESGVGWCILDTPGRASDVAVEAAKAADLVLLPARPSFWDVKTLPSAIEMLQQAGMPKAFLVLNGTPIQDDEYVKDARGAAEAIGLSICPVIFHQRVAFMNASKYGQGASEHQPKGRAAEEAQSLYEFSRKMLSMKIEKLRSNARERA